jgi:N-acetylglucosamine kinase-like BadF-type ATPase
MDEAVYFLGVDGGGSKTRALIANAQNEVIAEVASDPSNPKNTGLDAGCQAVMDTVRTVHQEAQAKLGATSALPIAAGCLGLAGLNTHEDFQKISLIFQGLSDRPLLGRSLLIVNDAYIGFKSASSNSWGITIIAGTGANCYGVSPQGEVFTSGDWSYLLGDQHSGFALGSTLAQEVMREYDGRSPFSPLSPIILGDLKLNSALEFYNYIHSQPNPVQAIASLAPFVTHPELQDHPVVVAALKRSISALTVSYQAVLKKLEVQSPPAFDVVLMGGLFNLKDCFTRPVMENLSVLSPEAQLITASRPPSWGAVNLACNFSPGSFLPQLSWVLNP